MQDAGCKLLGADLPYMLEAGRFQILSWEVLGVGSKNIFADKSPEWLPSLVL